MRYLGLGKTGITVSEVGFGGIPIIRLDGGAAHRVLRRAVERGITLYDTANAYRDSEEKMGIAFTGLRHQLVIATKTLRRDAATAMEHLEHSLRTLRTDYIDLYQLHQIAREEDFQAVTAPGGALEAVIRAKQSGKVRHVGVTSHSLKMAVRLVKTGLFSTIQFPYNFLEPDAARELFPVARELGVGLLVMKPFAGGVIDLAGIAFRFLRRDPDAIPIPGFDCERAVDEIVDIYGEDNVASEGDDALMDDYRKKLGKAFCRRCEYCLPCPQGVMIPLAMGYPLFVSRMGPEVAADFARATMESAASCAECGECVDRCPYELPIPEVLKRNRALYEGQVRRRPDLASG